MTSYPLGSLQLNNQESAWQRLLRYAALLGLIIAIGLVAFAAVNTALPLFAQLRIQAAVNVLNQQQFGAPQHQAMRELENAGDAAVPALVAALASENPVLRQNAADMLGFIASPASQAALRDTLLNDAQPQVRQNAAWALGEIQDLASWNVLQQAAVLDHSQAVRQSAADSIARIRTRIALTAHVNESALSAAAVAPGNPNYAYFTTRRNLVSTGDGGKSWTSHANVLPSLVNTLAISPTDAKVLYAGADGMGLFKSTDAGATWSAVNNGLGLMPGARFSVTAIQIDAANPQQVVAATGVWLGTSHVEFFPIGVMRTLDGGASWQADE